MRTVALAYIALVIAALIGWVMNLIEVIHLATAGAPLTAGFIVRIVGVPVGIIGAVMGWF